MTLREHITSALPKAAELYSSFGLGGGAEIEALKVMMEEVLLCWVLVYY